MTSGAAAPAATTVTVLIATPLEAGHVDRITAADSRVRVLYEPGLLPVPQFAADHAGVPRELSAAELARWSELRSRADVSFDFDWQAPGQMAANCPRLRWVQGTSAGLGGFLDRTGLASTDLVVTTAAGVHGYRWPSSRCSGCCTSRRTCPRSAAGRTTAIGSSITPGGWPAPGRCWSAWAASAGRLPGCWPPP